MVCVLFSIQIVSPQLRYTKKKQKAISLFRLLIQKDAQFLFFRRDFETIFSTTFSVWFFKIKNQKNSNLQSDQVS